MLRILSRDLPSLREAWEDPLAEWARGRETLGARLWRVGSEPLFFLAFAGGIYLYHFLKIPWYAGLISLVAFVLTAILIHRVQHSRERFRRGSVGLMDALLVDPTLSKTAWAEIPLSGPRAARLLLYDAYRYQDGGGMAGLAYSILGGLIRADVTANPGPFLIVTVIGLTLILIAPQVSLLSGLNRVLARVAFPGLPAMSDSELYEFGESAPPTPKSETLRRAGWWCLLIGIVTLTIGLPIGLFLGANVALACVVLGVAFAGMMVLLSLIALSLRQRGTTAALVARLETHWEALRSGTDMPAKD